MATIVAVRSGNWSDTSHVTGPWPGASTPTAKPASNDTVQSGAYTVTIDESITVAVLTATSTGHFEITGAPISVTVGTLSCTTSYTGGGLRCSHASGTITITATALTTAGGVTNLANIGAGTIQATITQSTAGTSSDGVAIANNSNGTINITGNVTGGSGANRCYGIHNAGVGSVSVNGTVTSNSGNNSYGAYNASTGTLSVHTAVAASNASAPGLYGLNSGGTTTYQIIGSQANGNFGVGGFCKMVVNPTVNKITVKRSDTGADYELSNDYPATTDVKSGVTYKLGTQLGTLAGGAVSVSPYRGNLG